ncbi:heme-degrading monooxygenase HmoA [Leeuwenhoekiella aestuarii]|uniref:Heme-degrading monooxygenase HmoA n=1 Tax=Leeuwenhoekiella aestuarii TaxID=2249426 RepID=A0A4Q0NZP4_9FLAO|nr:antibiotic biosynthesis monooxygenase [Leeuwenhoekiella aestuarii]RXG18065.1 heme-degrading monooxygenase HmoA [Leeuwenhoekiella aestuarii]RXG19371.1 heme-degrading monooxygenase HmoA [Leeuwenhoekiella aestuarii]
MKSLPYYAVIFTSTQNENTTGYSEMAAQMEHLAKLQPGYLGIDHARSEVGITISYWQTEADLLNWKNNLEHLKAQHLGKHQWYAEYSVRVCKVEREYHFTKS